MKVKVRKIGNAEGFVIPKQMLTRLGWKAGDKLALSTTDGVINLQDAEADIEDQMETATEGTSTKLRQASLLIRKAITP